MKRIIAIFAGTVVAAAVLPVVTARAGGTATACGMDWMQIEVPGNSYYFIKNAPPARNNTCVQAEPGKAGFTILSTDQHALWGFPHVASGWEWGEYTCFHAADACFQYPVQERSDGTPETSLSVAMRGSGNASYDVWFNKTSAKSVGQNNGAEIMLWLKHPGIGLRDVVRTVTIEGIKFQVMSWVAHGHGTTWNYVAYVCVTQRSTLTDFWLNGLFRDAIANNELSPDWWLTDISAGFELTSGGAGSQLTMSLRGVN